jgi:proteic killer suppression protein
VIGNFADMEVEKIWGRRPSRRLPADIQFAALRKLRTLCNARALEDLRIDVEIVD